MTTPPVTDLRDPPPQPAPPAASGPSAGTAKPSLPWRDRLPELAAGAGTVMLTTATIALISTTWTELSMLLQGVVLLSVAGLLTAAGRYADRPGTQTSAGLLFAAATVAMIAGMVLTLDSQLVSRATIAVAGLAGAALAGWAWTRHPNSSLRTAAATIALLYAAGPPGTAAGDRWSDAGLPAADALRGLLEPGYTTPTLALMTAGWVICAGLLALAATAGPASGRNVTARAAGLVVLAAAVLVNVSTLPGAVLVALCMSGSYLVYGLINERPLVLTVGAVTTVLIALRFLAAMFSGQVVVILAALIVGAALITWSVHARSEAATSSSSTDSSSGTSSVQNTDSRTAAPTPVSATEAGAD